MKAAVALSCFHTEHVPEVERAEVLIRRWQAGDKKASNDFFNLYKFTVYHWARIKTRDHDSAEDLCQEVWKRIHRSLLTYHAGTSPKAWIYRILINTHRSLWRRGQCLIGQLAARLLSESAHSESANSYYSVAITPESILARKQQIEVVISVLRNISEPYQTVIFLRYMEGLSIEEIAEIHRVSIGTVKSRQNRGIEQMRELLGISKEFLQGGTR